MQVVDNDSPHFFRLLTAYYLGKIASNMRAVIELPPNMGNPVILNTYCINLAPSGYGKGFSTATLEQNVLNPFRERFSAEIINRRKQEIIAKFAREIEIEKGCSPEEAVDKAEAKLKAMGVFKFSFSEATVPALKQQRYLLIQLKAGALSLEMDEVFDNLSGNKDVLTTYLELFDSGYTKDKLIKHTKEQEHFDDLVGATPANMMLFGTASKLLEGGVIEQEFDSMIVKGYARRPLFGFTVQPPNINTISGKELYTRMQAQSPHIELNAIGVKLGALANFKNLSKKLAIDKDTFIYYLDYKLKCKKEAEGMRNNEMLSSEISNKHFKALKLAGVYAFADQSDYVTQAHLDQAIALVEDSSVQFSQLIKRPSPHIRLADYILTADRSLTLSDLEAECPYYKGTMLKKKEILDLAISYAYSQSNLITVTKSASGIDVVNGSKLKSTDLDKMIISASKEISDNYLNKEIPFGDIDKIACQSGVHWVNHKVDESRRRREDTMVEGFNMIVLDVDSTATVQEVTRVLKEYAYFIYTTKRHTNVEHRFRIILPISHILYLSSENYAELLTNIYSWLPFDVDTATNQRCRKWLSHNGKHKYNEGKVLNVLHLVPNTAKAVDYNNRLKTQTNIPRLARWFLNNTSNGNRNNQLLKYAFALLDAGIDKAKTMEQVLELNSQLPEPLPEIRINNTIGVTVAKR